MAEEIRRSGRATKGQYTKDRDIAEEGPPTGKRKGNGKGSKGKAVEEEPEEEEDEKIRCICGQYDEEEEGRAMICCDNCEVWQHNDCMGLAEDYAPDKYYCEECHPEDHQDTVAALERGEKIWEIRKQAVEAEKASKKKGGKKGRKSAPRSSEVPSRASQDTEEAPLREAAGRGSKRKLEESTNEGDMKDIKKVRGTSTPAEKETKPASQRKSSSMNTPSRGVSRSETNFGPVVTDVNQLPVQRKGVAGGLIKTFVEQTNDAVKQDTYSVPSGSTTKEVGTQLALRVEHALYNVKSPGAPEPNEAYKEQFRSILFNVKNNPSLRDRLLRGEVTAEALASMDAKDMASEEQQRKDAETKKALEKQHTIIQEQGPRIRRTHKGEEYVNEADQVAAESTTSHAPVRRESMNVENDVQMQSPPSEPAPNRPRQLSVNTQGKPRASREPQRQSSTNFDINNVWSSVQGSPDAEHHQFPELPQRSPGGPVREAAGPGAGEDAEIDALLKDEDAESEPYSPKDYADGDDVIWRGVVNGNTLGRFHATAQYAAGCTPEALGLTYRELIPAELTISGRIDPSKADEYLCGLQYSTTSDVIVVSIRQPETPPDLAQFNKLFDYFKTRTRYGVAIQHSNPAIKDIYLIPLEVGQGVPELLKLLDNDKIPERITERLLMVPFVVKNTELPENSTFGAKLRGGDMPPTPTTQQTPITPYENQFDYQQQPPPGVPYSHPPSLPTHPQVSNGTPTPQPFPSHPHYNTPPPHYAPPGGTVAAQVLGPLAGAPAVLELLRQVPNADADQLSIVREICEQNPRAAQELPILEQALRARGAPQ